MGYPPFDDEECKMLENSLSKSGIKIRKNVAYVTNTYMYPFINCFMNFLGILMLLSISTFHVLSKYGLNYWICLMEFLGRKRIIMDRVNDEPYLERYYVFLKDRHERFPFNIFIHKFLKSDPDDLHDHPWGYFTLILCGGYWEYVYEGEIANSDIVKHWRGPGFYQSVTSSHTHRIELDPEKPNCWTLFIPRVRSKKWGFYENNNWIEADQYLESRQKKD